MSSPYPPHLRRFGDSQPKKPSPFSQLLSKRSGRRGGGPQDEIGHAPSWMVNFADLMTEMFCLFVVLYAFSAALNKDVQDVRKQIEQVMHDEKIEGHIDIKKDGISISLQEGESLSFFESGEALLTFEGLSVLEKVIPILLKAPGDIIVEGHTDSVPIRNERFPSNWELSTARATHVVRYLIDQKGVDSKRLAAIGYGDNRPLGDNATPEGRAKNRRVVFFIKTGKEEIRETTDPSSIPVIEQVPDASEPPTAPVEQPSEEPKIETIPS